MSRLRTWLRCRLRSHQYRQQTFEGLIWDPGVMKTLAVKHHSLLCERCHRVFEWEAVVEEEHL